MPEVNLLQDTKSPDLPPKKPRKPGQPDLSSPAGEPGGISKFFHFGKKSGAPLDSPQRKLGASPDTSKMGLGRSKPEQRIINEKRSNPPKAMVPLPEDDEAGFNVNLLSEDLYTKFKPRQKLMQLGLVALGAAAVVGLIFFGLDLLQRSVTSDVTNKQAELATVRSQIDSLKNEQQAIQNTTKKIAAIRDLIDQHTRWTQFFARLESYTLSNVFYGPAFSGDIKGSMTFTATTDSFNSVAKQYLVFQQALAAGNFISSFTISNATRSVTAAGSQVHFTVSFNVLPSVFLDTGQTAGQTTTTPTPWKHQLFLLLSYQIISAGPLQP